VESTTVQFSAVIFWFMPWLVMALRHGRGTLALKQVSDKGTLSAAIAFILTFILVARGIDFPLACLLASGFTFLISIYFFTANATEDAQHSMPRGDPAPKMLRQQGQTVPGTPSINPWTPAQVEADLSKLVVRRSHVVIESIRTGATSRHPGTALHPDTPSPPPRIVDIVGRNAIRDHPGTAPLVSSARPAATSSNPRQGSGLDSAEWQIESFLKRAGYSAGARGPMSWQRHDALKRAYAMRLPADMPEEYRLDCGATASSRRLQRMVDHLNWLIDFNGSTKRNMTQAVNDWRADLRWLQSEYGDRHPGVVFQRR
jgi:hypothetical protein